MYKDKKYDAEGYGRARDMNAARVALRDAEDYKKRVATMREEESLMQRQNRMKSARRIANGAFLAAALTVLAGCCTVKNTSEDRYREVLFEASRIALLSNELQIMTTSKHEFEEIFRQEIQQGMRKEALEERTWRKVEVDLNKLKRIRRELELEVVRIRTIVKNYAVY